MSETYYLGVDLGTSRTSIATSTGARQTTVTCVGYSKDVVSRKRFDKDYLLGEEALRNRLALDMVWPMGMGVIKSNDNLLFPRFYVVRGLEDWLHETIRDWIAERPNWMT